MSKAVIGNLAEKKKKRVKVIEHFNVIPILFMYVLYSRLQKKRELTKNRAVNKMSLK